MMALDRNTAFQKNDDEPRSLAVLGATGSIGGNTLDIVARNPKLFRVRVLSAHNNVEQLAGLARKFQVERAVIANEAHYSDLKAALAGSGVEVAAGEQGLVEAAALPVDITMAGIIGAAGLRPTLEAVRQGNRVALANKECLVAAGDLFMKEVARSNAELLPVDSEHSAIFQSLDGGVADTITTITLTASGGPFRGRSLNELREVTPEQALKHPNWSMGRKISIDSATMMNKGLELIEALHLFPVEPDQLDVVVHPQSIIHSMVSYVDGSVIAQLGMPDMRTPIVYALSWPGRLKTPVEQLDLAKIASLTFEAPDENRFPALRLAKTAMRAGGSAPLIMNAANEVAVEAFLENRLKFLDIAPFCEDMIGKVQAQSGTHSPDTLAEVLDIDHITRKLAQSSIIV